MTDLRSLGARSQAPFDPRVRPIAAGTFAQRPAANLVRFDRYGGSFYYATDIGILYYSDGVAWTALNAGVSIIAEIDLTATTTVSSSIPGTYDHLRLVISARSSQVATFAGLFLRFNNDTGANYDYVLLRGNNSVATSGTLIAQTEGGIGAIPAASATVDQFGQSEVLIANYAGATRKTYTATASAVATAAAANMFADVEGGLWRNTAAITRIDLVNTGGNAFVSGSRAWLYGMRGA